MDKYLYTSQLWDRPKKVFDQNSVLQAACDTSITRVTGCVYPPREGYRSVTPLLLPGWTGQRRSTLLCARKPYNPHWGGPNQTSVEFSMHETIILYDVVWASSWGVAYLGLPCSHASTCVLPVYVAGQRRSSPGLLLGLLVLSSHDETYGGRRSLLFRSDLASAYTTGVVYIHAKLDQEEGCLNPHCNNKTKPCKKTTTHTCKNNRKPKDCRNETETKDITTWKITRQKKKKKEHVSTNDVYLIGTTVVGGEPQCTEDRGETGRHPKHRMNKQNSVAAIRARMSRSFCWSRLIDRTSAMPRAKMPGNGQESSASNQWRLSVCS